MKRILMVLTLMLLAGQAEAVRLVVDDVDATTGCFHAKSNAYAAARDTIEATDSYSSATRLGWDNSNKQNYRILTRWLTLPIPDAAVIDSAKIKLPVTTNSSTTDFFLKLCAVDPDSLQGQSKWTKGEYNGFVGWDATPGNPYTVTLLADTVSTSTLGAAPADTLTLRLNAAGIAAISKSDTTQFYILSNIDANYVSLSNDAYIYINDDNLYMEVFYHIEGLYLDATSGSDLAAGDASNPWKTLSPVNLADLIAGDYVYLKAGDEYGANQTGQDGTSKSDTCLVVPSSGSEGSPITFTRYGTGADPIISAAMQVQGWEEIGSSTPKIFGCLKATVNDSCYAMWDGANKDSLMTRVVTRATLDQHGEWFATADSIFVCMRAASDTTNLFRSKNYAITTNTKDYITFSDLQVKYGTGLTSTTTIDINITNSSDYITINNCYFIGSLRGINIGSGTYPTITNSIFNSLYFYGIYSSSSSLSLYNNIFYNGAVQVRTTEAGTIVKNNLFVSPTTYFINTDAGELPVMDHNYYAASSLANKWNNGTNHSSLLGTNGWSSTIGGQDSVGSVSSTTTDNIFDSNYRPLYGSPVVNAGTDVGVTTDYDGNVRIVPDIGAFERKDKAIISGTKTYLKPGTTTVYRSNP